MVFVIISLQNFIGHAELTDKWKNHMDRGASFSSRPSGQRDCTQRAFLFPGKISHQYIML